MSVPLDTKGENYNEDVEGAMQLEQLTLRSKPTILDTSYAVAQIRYRPWLKTNSHCPVAYD